MLALHCTNIMGCRATGFLLPAERPRIGSIVIFFIATDRRRSCLETSTYAEAFLALLHHLFTANPTYLPLREFRSLCES
jgi:hypothetical protein